jgi:four helix bundle protein
MKIERFEDIESWQMGRLIAQQVDVWVRDTGLGRDFPLRDQMSRSAGSIMDNIAEGFDAGSNAEFVRFLRYSKRSCTELQSQMYRALDREYINRDTFLQWYEQARVAKAKIGAFIQYLLKHNNLEP